MRQCGTQRTRAHAAAKAELHDCRYAADQLLKWWRGQRAGLGDRAGLHPTTVAALLLKIADKLDAKEERDGTL